MRLPRIDWPGARHHVMNRGGRREDIFPHDESRDVFLDILSKLPQRFDVRVHGYALMPNHYHLMLESVSGKLPRAMQRLASQYTLTVNAMMGWDGPIFRGRYRNRVVDGNDYWRHLLVYLHLNPSRAHLDGLEDPRWTSHNAYVGATPRPDWLTTAALQQEFGSQAAYEGVIREVMGGSMPTTEEFDPGRLWKPTSTGVVAGPPSLEPYLELSEALAKVCRVTGMDLDAVLAPSRGRRINRANWVAAWWMSRRCAISHGRIVAAFATSHASVSRIVRRVEERRFDDPVLTAWITQLERREEPPA